MKAAFIKKLGTPEVIEWGDLPMPIVKDDEVLVKVNAVTISPIDTYIRSGKYEQKPPLTFPYIIGEDMVGTVSKIGSKVINFKPGDLVWCNSLGTNGRQGSFAEYVSVNADLLYHAPKNVKPASIVAVLNSGATALLGLIREAVLKTTDTIFVNGGGGNIGSAVIQLAKGRGARVIASTSGKEKIEWCKSIGADVVYDYHQDNIEEKIKKDAPNGVNIFWDTSKNPNFDLGVSLLSHKGLIILMAGSGAKPPFPVGPFYRKECSMKGFSLLQASKVELSQYAEIMNVALEKNHLKSKIAHVMPMSEALKAHQMIESQSDLWGKIVLTI